MQLILTPLILQLMERKEAHDMNAPALSRIMTVRMSRMPRWRMPFAFSRSMRSNGQNPATPACR